MKSKIIIIVVVVVLAVAAAAVFLLMPKEAVRVYLSPGEAFVTNIPDSESLIKTTITLVISDNIADELTQHNSLIRNTILNVLRNQPLEVYQSGDMQSIVGNQIIDQLNAHFPADEKATEPIFIRVDFNDFVMQ